MTDEVYSLIVLGQAGERRNQMKLEGLQWCREELRGIRYKKKIKAINALSLGWEPIRSAIWSLASFTLTQSLCIIWSSFSLADTICAGVIDK